MWDVVRLAVLLVVVLAAEVLAGCEEDMGQSNWLRVENNTSEPIYVQEGDGTGENYVVEVGPGEIERAPGRDACDLGELTARSASIDGPVVATRSYDEGHDCTRTWEIGLDDRGPTPYWSSY